MMGEGLNVFWHDLRALARNDPALQSLLVRHGYVVRAGLANAGVWEKDDECAVERLSAKLASARRSGDYRTVLIPTRAALEDFAA